MRPRVRSPGGMQGRMTIERPTGPRGVRRRRSCQIPPEPPAARRSFAGRRHARDGKDQKRCRIASRTTPPGWKAPPPSCLPVTPDDATDLAVVLACAQCHAVGSRAGQHRRRVHRQRLYRRRHRLPGPRDAGLGHRHDRHRHHSAQLSPGARRDADRSRHLRHRRRPPLTGDGLVLPQPASPPMVSGDAVEGADAERGRQRRLGA
jgi:hypothetical protein